MQKQAPKTHQEQTLQCVPAVERCKWAETRRARWTNSSLHTAFYLHASKRCDKRYVAMLALSVLIVYGVELRVQVRNKQ
jgi:hypothetical protein